MNRYLFKSCLILGVLLLAGIPAQSQGYPKSNFEFAGGFGWPDMATFKIKYGEDFQVGLSQGLMLNSAVEIYWHFAGKTKWTDRKVWYGMCGIDYFYWGWEEENWFPYLRIGRTLNFDRRYGLNIDAGAFYLKNQSDFFSSSHYSPSGSVTFFFRL